MTPARVVYDGAHVRLFDPHGRDEARRFGDEDRQRLEPLAVRYEQAVRRERQGDLLTIGQQLAAWLDGDRGWWRRIVEQAVPPLELEIEVPRRGKDPGAKALLMAPWELLADDSG